MPKVAQLRKDSKRFALIPVVIGMAGVLFAAQLEDPILRAVVIVLCLAVPLMVGGNILGRYQMDFFQRFFLLAGMGMLIVGALYGILGYSQSLSELEMVPTSIVDLSRVLGLASLLLGLIVVLVSLIRSQAIIEEMSERFRHISQHMAEGFVLTGYDGRIVMVNPSLLEMIGLLEADLVGRNALELARELGDETMARFAESGSHGMASDYEVSWTPKDEELHFSVSGTPIYDRRGRPVGTLAIIRDITKQHGLSKRLAEYTQRLEEIVEDRTARLRSSEKRLRDLLQNMSEGFLTIDTECAVLFANDRICDLFRSSQKDLIGRNVLDLVVSDQRQRLQDSLEGALSMQQDLPHQEFALTRSDGSSVPVKVGVAPISDLPTGGRGFSLVITDIGELKHMQHQVELRARQLEQVNEELVRLDRAKDVFLSNVSHELRTPLTTLQGYVEMLLAGSLEELQAPQVGALNVMGRNADRLSRLINEMIEFSRMEIQGVRLNKTLFSPSHLVEECILSAQPQALVKDIALTSEVESKLPPMWGDREKLCQVIGILLSNAIKFSNEGAVVHVYAKREGAHGLELAVVDEGIGIEPKYHEQIFAKFYQVDGSMTRSYQGTGIGLSIARSILDAHDGSITVESRSKEGSTFATHFPEALFEPQLADAPSGELGGMTVFVANPHPEFRESVSGLLTRFGCEVQDFRDGHDCLRAARDQQPNVIVVDEALPDLSGAEAASLLKEEIATSEIPVILLRSGRLEGTLEEELLEQGVSLLDKPFTAAQLAEAVRDTRSVEVVVGETLREGDAGTEDASSLG